MFIFLLDFTVGQSPDERVRGRAALCIIVVKAFSWREKSGRLSGSQKMFLPALAEVVVRYTKSGVELLVIVID